MFKAYQDIFTPPGSKLFSAAGFVARMPISMTSIGLVTMLSQMRGGYGLAGAIAAVFALATALISPQLSRLVDRLGQSRVLLPAGMVSAASIGALLLLARFGAPDWTLFICALFAGCMPSMPAMVRARWTELYRGSPKLHTAFSFESVLDEICFIIGPILSVGLSVSVFPEAGPLAACLFLITGILLFTRQKSSEPAIRPQLTGESGSVLRLGSIRMLAFTFVAIGIIFSTVDVVTVAFAEYQGYKVGASYVLAIYATGSCLAGLVFGLLKIKQTLQRQFLTGVALMTLTLLPLLLVDSMTKLALIVFFSGLTVAPTMIITMGLIEKIVPSHQLTEGMTWATTGLGIGVASGSAVAGWVIDTISVQSGFSVAIAAGVLALVISLLGYKILLSAYKPAPAKEHV
ncbi:MFS transporter [Paenibacillus sp. GCM10012307]|uniref:MFS transporter n=1 Tax=Paenibacillus roseus TaxID=2798579 RepID=A0A934J3H9_9BACL|nr:MFS transporter [Paenibacillus roseus]MBJ6359765.1 MFS transporter [Paenibacillus roseus]